jgi:signal transduction histidine kinase
VIVEEELQDSGAFQYFAVLLNLLRNAAQEMMRKDYQGDRPRITLRLKNAGASARIEVEDNGPGMTEEIKRVHPLLTQFISVEEKETWKGIEADYFTTTQ